MAARMAEAGARRAMRRAAPPCMAPQRAPGLTPRRTYARRAQIPATLFQWQLAAFGGVMVINILNILFCTSQVRGAAAGSCLRQGNPRRWGAAGRRATAARGGAGGCPHASRSARDAWALSRAGGAPCATARPARHP
jgi:hypothetical protein